MFRSRWLDRLSRVHPAVPVVLFLPTIVLLTAYAGGHMNDLDVAAVALCGYVLWTLTEYWMHRIVFHFEPQDGLGARLHWIIHGVHHDHPNDPLRLVMPPSVSVPLASAFVALFVVVLGAPAAWLVGSGFLCGYLIYDMTHYHLHHHKPSTRLGRVMRELHMRHHFQDEHTAYGVSAPWWDRVFGTAPPPGRH